MSSTQCKAPSALRDTLISAFEEIDAFGLRCTPGTWLYLHGLRAAFGRVNSAGRRHRRESKSADAALLEA